MIPGLSLTTSYERHPVGMSSSTVFHADEERSKLSCLYCSRYEVTWARLDDGIVHWTRTDVSDTAETSGRDGDANAADHHTHTHTRHTCNNNKMIKPCPRLTSAHG